jgi:hypothetical protein
MNPQITIPAAAATAAAAALLRPLVLPRRLALLVSMPTKLARWRRSKRVFCCSARCLKFTPDRPFFGAMDGLKLAPAHLILHGLGQAALAGAGGGGGWNHFPTTIVVMLARLMMPGRVRGSFVCHGTKAGAFMRPVFVLAATFFASLAPAFLASSFLAAALATAHALAHLLREGGAVLLLETMKPWCPGTSLESLPGS